MVVALSSGVAAIGLTSRKLVVGLLTGSLGILAEAAHSGLDLVAALGRRGLAGGGQQGGGTGGDDDEPERCRPSGNLRGAVGRHSSFFRRRLPS